jgi:hypothetical protein
MAILGYTTSGAASLGAAVGRKIASKHTLASAQTLTELHAWFNGGAFTSNTLVIHIHADSSGSPGARVAYTSGIPFSNGTGGSVTVELSQTGFSVPLAAGDYWLGLTFTSGDGNVRCESTGATSKAILSGATVSPPSDPFGTTDYTGTDKLSVWAVVGAGGGGGGAAGSVLERKAGSGSVDPDDWASLVDAVVLLGGAVATRKGGSGAVSVTDYNAVVDAVVTLGGSVATRKAGSGDVDVASYNALVDAVKLLGAA